MKTKCVKDYIYCKEQQLQMFCEDELSDKFSNEFSIEISNVFSFEMPSEFLFEMSNGFLEQFSDEFTIVNVFRRPYPLTNFASDSESFISAFFTSAWYPDEKVWK